MIQTTQDIITQSKPLIAENADFIGQIKKGSTSQMLRFRIFQIFRICTLGSNDPYISQLTLGYSMCSVSSIQIMLNVDFNGVRVDNWALFYTFLSEVSAKPGFRNNFFFPNT
jgi:hypothetical protein